MDNLTDNATPIDDTFKFTLGDISYTIGMYPHPTMPEDARAELRANGVAVIQRNWTWEDLESDFTSDMLANMCISAFNKYLAIHHTSDGSTEDRSYEQRMAEFFLNRIELHGNQLMVITDAIS